MPAVLLAAYGLAQPGASRAAPEGCLEVNGVTTCEFDTNSPNPVDWEIPEGVTEVMITAAGGQGGGENGGQGATVTATLEVPSGGPHILEITVGTDGDAVTAVGGGGAAGGPAEYMGYTNPTAGHAGGGASVVRLDDEILLIVAAGGGGASADGVLGGGGGVQTGDPGYGIPPSVGGHGGTAGIPGVGGEAFDYEADPSPSCAGPGTADNGESGANALGSTGGAGGDGYAGGGGGGGGFPGGGGGAGGWVCVDDDNDLVEAGGSGGGGGGASFANGALAGVTTMPSDNGGEGYVTVSYTTDGGEPPTYDGYLETTLATGDAAPTGEDQNLTAAGATDWAIWGLGTNTSLAPNVRKAGGSAISDLTGVVPAPNPEVNLRALGQFPTPGVVPWRFDWTDGDGVATADSAVAGLQWDGHTGQEGSPEDLTGFGFSFTVPAGTDPQRLHVWTHAHGSQGLLVASLSDESAPDLYNGYVNATNSYNTPGLFVIDFAAASEGQTLTVQYTMDVRLADANSVSANPAIYAVALAPQLVTNGGFEQPSISGSGYVDLPAGSPDLPGWTIGMDGIQHIELDFWSAFDGLQSVDLAGNAAGSIEQMLSTVPGETYWLSYAFAANPQGSGASMDVEWDGAVVASESAPGALDPGGSGLTPAWETASFAVVATGTSTVVRFENTSAAPGPGFGMALDDVSVIPLDVGGEEPGEVEAPVLLRAAPVDSDTTFVVGMTPEPGTYQLSFVSSDDCVAGVIGVEPTVIGGFSVTTSEGEPYFAGSFDHTGPAGDYLAVEVIGPGDTESAVSDCIAIQPDNDSWVNALRMELSGGSASTSGVLDSEGNARWFKFTIAPGARVTMDLTGLPKDYDLFLFKDIAQAYDTLTTEADLTRISAEFAPSAFAPSAFAPSAFAPSAFAPSAFAPSAFAPSAFAPSAFAPSAFAPSAFAPSAFAPSAFAPSAFAPSAFAPSAFAPSAFAPSAFAPSAFAPSAFAGAQVRSLIGISALPGTGDEWIVADTWNNTGDFYVRVSGKNGEFDTTTPFSLDVSVSGTACTGSIPGLGTAPIATDGDFETIVLTALGRMPDATADKAAMLAALDDLPSAVVVDVDAYTSALHAFADANYGCPYYKNLVADAIKGVVDDYRALNPIEHVVIVGNDDVIPFFRYPDQSLLGPEQDFRPPVGTATTSEGSLRSNMVLGQDEYGASTSISVRGASFPVPDLAVGRLVETATEVTGMVQAYLGTTGGVVPTPTSSLVTGYDFIADAADTIDDELSAGIGTPARRLVTPGDIAPQDPASWTADDLREAFLEQRNDIAFLGGHFSASGALAADFVTEMRSSELVASTVDFTNSIVFSIGCHSGYSVVDTHGVSGVTETLDWAQAFARKRATLIAGTGYQYGDTDFIEYSERLYLEFAKQLRTGSGPVAVGDALVAAKAAYLRTTPDIRGLHEKSLLEASLFGLPMLSVDMPGTRLPDPSGSSEVGGTTEYDDEPGADLGLEFADVTANAGVNEQTKSLTNLDGGPDIVTTYFTGPDGVTTNPLEPALPLDVKNVTVPGKVLRGVGFLGGSYTEQTVVPLTGAPNTEIRGVHIPFSSSVFYPIRPWTPNYFDALGGGPTNLLVTPVQHRSVALGDIDAIARVFSSMNLRLFYSDNIQTYGTGDEAATPALAAPPTITGATATVDGTTVTFTARVVGDPAAGIQEAWATYTGHAGAWVSVPMTQSAADSTIWTGSATVTGLDPGEELRFMVQAVNGVGLVTVADDFGAFYRASIAGTPPPQPASSSLSLTGSDASGAFGSTMTAQATLASSGPISGKTIVFDLGGAVRIGTTNASGVATVQIDVTSTGTLPLRATFAGDDGTGSSNAAASFTAAKAGAQLTLAGPGTAPVGADASVVATLTAGSVSLTDKALVFRITAPGGGQTFVVRNTDIAGQARIQAPTDAAGAYTVDAFFGSTVSTPNGPVGGPDPDYAASTASDGYLVAAPQIYAFTSNRDGNQEIYTMSPDGSGQTRRTNHIAYDTEASFSPDGSKIAFASGRTGLGDIYTMNVDGTGLTRLTTNLNIDGAPAWSPDGTKIAFTSRRNGNFEIYVMNANGSSQTRLTNNKALDNEPEWSPDGTKLSFTSTRTGAGDIYVMNADGSGVARLTTHSAIDGTSAWSPDGSKIAFTSRRNGNFEIYVMNANGSSQTRLTNHSAIDTEPVWSTDGAKIVFQSTRTGNGDIYSMNPNGTGVTRLTTSNGVDGSPATR